MSYSITNANADLQAVLHGTSLNKVQGVNNLHDRTARQLLLDIDPIETERKILTTTPIFNQVFDYACPVDLKGNRIIDISPQYQRNNGDYLSSNYQQSFDIGKNLSRIPSAFTIQYNNSVKTIRINDISLPAATVIEACEDESVWTSGGTASNVRIDNINYAVGSSSIKFDMTAGVGSIVTTLSSTLDLSSQLNQASLFYYLYLPSSITSTEIRWGSDSSNYYYVNNTTSNEGTNLSTGWNLIRANWLNASVSGSPDVTNINYLYINVTSATNLTGVSIDNVISDMGLYRTMKYYSKYLFRDAITGAFQEKVTDNSNLINLDTESYNLYFNLLAFYATQQVQGTDALNFDSNFFGQEYVKGKTRYTSLIKSEVTKPREQYYAPNKGGYGKFLGRRYNQ